MKETNLKRPIQQECRGISQPSVGRGCQKMKQKYSNVGAKLEARVARRRVRRLFWTTFFKFLMYLGFTVGVALILFIIMNVRL